MDQLLLTSINNTFALSASPKPGSATTTRTLHSDGRRTTEMTVFMARVPYAQEIQLKMLIFALIYPWYLFLHSRFYAHCSVKRFCHNCSCCQRARLIKVYWIVLYCIIRRCWYLYSSSAAVRLLNHYQQRQCGLCPSPPTLSPTCAASCDMVSNWHARVAVHQTDRPLPVLTMKLSHSW